MGLNSLTALVVSERAFTRSTIESIADIATTGGYYYLGRTFEMGKLNRKRKWHQGREFILTLVGIYMLVWFLPKLIYLWGLPVLQIYWGMEESWRSPDFMTRIYSDCHAWCSTNCFLYFGLFLLGVILFYLIYRVVFQPRNKDPDSIWDV